MNFFIQRDLQTNHLNLKCSLDEDKCTAYFTVYLPSSSLPLGDIALYSDGSLVPYRLDGTYFPEAYKAVSNYGKEHGLNPCFQPV